MAARMPQRNMLTGGQQNEFTPKRQSFLSSDFGLHGTWSSLPVEPCPRTDPLLCSPQLFISSRIIFMKYGPRFISRLRPFLRALALLVLGLASVCCVSQVGRVSTPTASLARSTRSNGAPSHKSAPRPPSCNAVGFLPIQLAPPPTARHKVTLSWKAGAPSADPAFGYCLYKSQTKIAPQLGLICSQCEPLNSAPVKGTSCVDDIVANGVTYSYVVRAVDAQGNPSGWSNVAAAPIPSSNQTSATPTSSPQPPLCRAASATK